MRLSGSEYASELGKPDASEILSPVAGVAGVIVHGHIPPCDSPPPCPVIGKGTERFSETTDVLLEHDWSLKRLTTAISASPFAAATLVQLTRNNINGSIADALFAESLAYSTLQHGEQFQAWLSTRQSREPKTFDRPPIQSERVGNRLELTLNRPENRNAWSTPMRDALVEQLQLALADNSLEEIRIRGAGPCFGAGGDLTEFGSARDAAEAHLTRQSRSPALLMEQLREKLNVHLHGACVGAGIELPAYASRVEAEQSAFFQLPEVNMGLIPGAGGTASILRRIGRSRFNYMALSGERIDVETAHIWGLIDAIVAADG